MDSEAREPGAGAGEGAEQVPDRTRQTSYRVPLILVGSGAGLLAVVVMVFVALALIHAREESRPSPCRDNLNQLAKGMSTYLNEYGDCRFYPWPSGRAGCGGSGDEADFGGAEWLASLYWTRVKPDPVIFICPSTTDTNRNGEDLGDAGCCGSLFRGGPDGKLLPEAVSYAAFGADSVAVWEREKGGRAGGPDKRAIKEESPPEAPMASGDTEGTINHGKAHRGGICVLFFDCHVEFWTQEKVDLERGVGEGELVALRN